MSKFANQQYSGPQLEGYLKRKYDTYNSIVETASKNTSLIKQIFITVIIGFMTVILGGLLGTACIAYVKYNNSFKEYLLEFSHIYKYIVYFIIALIIIFAIVCICLNAIWYKRQSNYRLLKQKALYEITIASNDRSQATQSIKEYEDEFNLFEYEAKKNCNCQMIKNILKESMIFIIPTAIIILFLSCLFIFL